MIKFKLFIRLCYAILCYAILHCLVDVIILSLCGLFFQVNFFPCYLFSLNPFLKWNNNRCHYVEKSTTSNCFLPEMNHFKKKCYCSMSKSIPYCENEVAENSQMFGGSWCLAIAWSLILPYSLKLEYNMARGHLQCKHTVSKPCERHARISWSNLRKKKKIHSAAFSDGCDGSEVTVITGW